MTRSKRSELEREHQPRTLRTRAELEPRPSRRDEQDIADFARDLNDARDRARTEARTSALVRSIRQLADRFRIVHDALHRPDARTSRSVRNLARRIHHDLRRLAQELEKPGE